MMLCRSNRAETSPWDRKNKGTFLATGTQPPRPRASFQVLPRISKKILESRDNPHPVTTFTNHFLVFVRFSMEESIPLLCESSCKSRRNLGCHLPCRYVLAVLSCSGFCVVYLLRVNLSVALVAMVNSTYANEKASANNPECHRNSSSASSQKVGCLKLIIKTVINWIFCLRAIISIFPLPTPGPRSYRGK